MLDELRYLLLVVEHGTLTAAAREAHLSQPALTAAVHRLEQAFGARLLHRGRGGARLTEAGEALVPCARAALRAVEAGRCAVEEVVGIRRGSVRVGAGATACTYLLPPILARFRVLHPQVRLLLRESTADEAIDALARGEIDLAVVTSPEGEPWFTDQLILVAAADFRVPARVDDAPFVTFRRGATTRALFERAFPGVEVVMELGSIAAVKGHARAGIGLALVGRSSVERDLEQGLLVRVDDPRVPIDRPLALVHPGVDTLAPAPAALRRLLLSAEGRPPSAGQGPVVAAPRTRARVRRQRSSR